MLEPFFRFHHQGPSNNPASLASLFFSLHALVLPDRLRGWLRLLVYLQRGSSQRRWRCGHQLAPETVEWSCGVTAVTVWLRHMSARNDLGYLLVYCLLRRTSPRASNKSGGLSVVDQMA